MKAGFSVSFYIHPVTGELVPIIPDRFCPKGTMIVGARELPLGQPALDVDVLPKVQLPDLGDEMVQGYAIQEIAPTKTAPEVFFFLCGVYEVLRLKGGNVFGVLKAITG